MNAVNFSRIARRLPHRVRTPRVEHHAAFHDLVARASQGDRNAVLAINFAFRREILEQARDALGPYKDDDEDVLQDFLLMLLSGLSPYEPEQGPPRVWMRRNVRILAHKQRAFREGHSNTPLTEPPETLRSPGS